MTDRQNNSSDRDDEERTSRLDRIEKLFEQNEIRLGRMILQQESDNRRILAIELADQSKEVMIMSLFARSSP